MKIKNIYKFYVVICLVVLAIWANDKIKNFGSCEDAMEMELLIDYSGNIVNKYIDSLNHLARTIKIKNEKGEMKKILMDWDKSGLFDYLDTGDSIVKVLDSYDVQVYKKNKLRTFTIDYKCPK